MTNRFQSIRKTVLDARYVKRCVLHMRYMSDRLPMREGEYGQIQQWLKSNVKALELYRNNTMQSTIFVILYAK